MYIEACVYIYIYVYTYTYPLCLYPHHGMDDQQATAEIWGASTALVALLLDEAKLAVATLGDSGLRRGGYGLQVRWAIWVM